MHLFKPYETYFLMSNVTEMISEEEQLFMVVLALLIDCSCLLFSILY